MKIARLKMLILFCVIVVGSMMGNEITKTHNLPQNGDNFTKTRIAFRRSWRELENWHKRRINRSK